MCIEVFLYVRRNVVSFGNGDAWVDLNVEVENKNNTVAARAQLVECDYSLGGGNAFACFGVYLIR